MRMEERRSGVIYVHTERENKANGGHENDH